MEEAYSTSLCAGRVPAEVAASVPGPRAFSVFPRGRRTPAQPFSSTRGRDGEWAVLTHMVHQAETVLKRPPKERMRAEAVQGEAQQARSTPTLPRHHGQHRRSVCAGALHQQASGARLGLGRRTERSKSVFAPASMHRGEGSARRLRSIVSSSGSSGGDGGSGSSSRVDSRRPSLASSAHTASSGPCSQHQHQHQHGLHGREVAEALHRQYFSMMASLDTDMAANAEGQPAAGRVQRSVVAGPPHHRRKLSVVTCAGPGERRVEPAGDEGAAVTPSAERLVAQLAEVAEAGDSRRLLMMVEPQLDVLGVLQLELLEQVSAACGERGLVLRRVFDHLGAVVDALRQSVRHHADSAAASLWGRRPSTKAGAAPAGTSQPAAAAGSSHGVFALAVHLLVELHGLEQAEQAQTRFAVESLQFDAGDKAGERHHLKYASRERTARRLQVQGELTELMRILELHAGHDAVFAAQLRAARMLATALEGSRRTCNVLLAEHRQLRDGRTAAQRVLTSAHARDQANRQLFDSFRREARQQAVRGEADAREARLRIAEQGRELAEARSEADALREQMFEAGSAAAATERALREELDGARVLASKLAGDLASLRAEADARAEAVVDAAVQCDILQDGSTSKRGGRGAGGRARTPQSVPAMPVPVAEPTSSAPAKSEEISVVLGQRGSGEASETGMLPLGAGLPPPKLQRFT